MKPETIKAIFTNVLFVIGVLLTVYGFSRGTLTVARIAIFDKYPLPSYEETRCESGPYMVKPVSPDGPDSTIGLTDAEIAAREAKCKQGLETDRKNKMVEDITSSATAIFAGIVLAFSFRKFIFK